ncbi:ATP-binding protein [Pseudomarimonas arenosa]|uniref:ATP-binding protein n=1 Tax=Pseudomarimonas arenosa TaxID=2774145 RepID=A0AAW3ZQ87_9GAMM|nr:ATP-binding protein [Pseudomarimonas arenosa]MBD8527267.1 ATP-binding protein [Pseudomarimonas arenosa]
MSKPRVLLSWSSGKDSAWSLHVLRQQNEVEVMGLLTTLNNTHQRVAMHAVRKSLLQAQAAAAGLPLWTIDLPWPCPNETYETLMSALMQRARSERVDEIAYGDLFLQDIRDYREARHQGSGIGTRFPLWQRPTDRLAREMIDGGLCARLTCVDPKQLDARFAGRDFDHGLLAELPPTVDPCGENGEFHSFAYRGPMFERPIAIASGDIVERDGFVFADLLPDD